MTSDEFAKSVAKFVKLPRRDVSILYRYLESTSRKKGKMDWVLLVFFVILFKKRASFYQISAKKVHWEKEYGRTEEEDFKEIGEEGRHCGNVARSVPRTG